MLATRWTTTVELKRPDSQQSLLPAPPPPPEKPQTIDISEAPAPVPAAAEAAPPATSEKEMTWEEGARKATTATSLAQQLALFAQEDEKERWGLRAGAATKEVEAIATLDGVVATPLLATAVSKEAQEQYYRLDRWYGSGRRGGGSSTSTPLDQARSFVIVLVVLATIGWCYMSTTSAYRGGGYEAVGKA